MIGSVAVLAACAFNSFPNYEILSADVSEPAPALERVVYRVEVDRHALNRFAITHVSKRHGAHQRPLLLLSPFLLPGAFYEISETGDYADSAAGALARAGYDVWLVDQRRTQLEPGSCENGADCTALAGWNFDAYSQDALFALSLEQHSGQRQKPVIGGFSAGSNTALAVLNRAPEEFAGAFLYEGTFFTRDPAIVQHNAPICTNLEAAIDAGALFDPSVAVLGEVLNLAHSDPSAPSPIPVFPPGTSNRQAMFYVFGSPPPAGALSPTAGFIRNIVDFNAQRFVYTNEQRLELVGPLFDRYGSLAALRDLSCGLAGQDDRYTRNLGQFRGDVLMYVEGTGFGQAMLDTASLFRHASSVRIERHPELGEADPYFGFRWQETFLYPLQGWLRHLH